MTILYNGIEGVTWDEVSKLDLPPELYIIADFSGGGRQTFYEVETGDRLTAVQWRHRFRYWLDGVPSAPTPPPGAPETHLSPSQKDKLEAVIHEVAPAFRARDHLRSAAAGYLSKKSSTQAKACEDAIAFHGNVFFGNPADGLSVPRKFYDATGYLRRRSQAVAAANH